MTHSATPTEKIDVVVLGSGTSSGIPVIGCHCPVCSSADPRDKRLRASILLRNQLRSIVVDCGIDYREQALRHRINRLDGILLTHSHSDHISGLDEIRIYNWLQKTTIPLYGNEPALTGLRSRYDYLFNPLQLGGGISQIDIQRIDDEAFDFQGLHVEPIPVMHGALPILGYRFGDFAYITDASYIPPDSMKKLEGVRWLILNALRHRPHPTHFNIEQALEIVSEIGPEQTWFTHIAHDLGHAETNAQLPPGVELAYDGLTFPIEARLTAENGAEANAP